MATLRNLILALLIWAGSVSAAPAACLAQDVQKRDCASPEVRIEWGNLKEQQKQAYLGAEKCLYTKSATSGMPGATNRIEDLAAVHQNMTASIHSVECNYTGPMPWWDETKDAGNFQKSPLMSPGYFGSAPAPTPSGGQTCLTDGAFGNTTLTVGPGMASMQHCLSRAVNSTVSNGVAQYIINACNAKTDYTDMWTCVNGGPHAAGHDAIGGVMADIDSSPSDPLFYMHHMFIDRNWASWQAANAANVYAIGGSSIQNCNSDCPQTTLSYTLAIGNIIPSVLIHDIMDIKGGYLCYSYDY